MNPHMREICPLLVAYAEDALAPEGRCWVEAQLARDPALRDELAAIRALRAPLTASLPAAPPALDPARRQRLLRAVARPRPGRGRLRLLAILAAGMAACVAAAIAFPGARPRPRIIEELGPETVPTRVTASAPSVSMRLPTGDNAVRKLEPLDDDGVWTAITAPAVPSRPSPVAESIEDQVEMSSTNTAQAVEDVKRRDLPAASMAADAEQQDGLMRDLRPPPTGLSGKAWSTTGGESFDSEAAMATGGRDLHPGVDTPVATDPDGHGSAIARNRSIQGDEEMHDVMRRETLEPALSTPPAAVLSQGVTLSPIGDDLTQRPSWSRGTPAAVLTGLLEAHLVSVDPSVPMDRILGDGTASSSEQALQEQPLGATLLHAAQALHLQVVLEDGGCRLRAPPVPLDPTDLGGWDPKRFLRAFATSPMQNTRQHPRLTFAFDADTASFDQAAAVLAHRRLPDPASIAPEQFINAMAMGYPPAHGPEAIALYADAGPSPFAIGTVAPRTALVALGVVTRAPRPDERRPLHLTLAIDTSGSMGRPEGLPLVQTALQALLPQLQRQDTICIVRFADQASVVLPPTPGDAQDRIRTAITGLSAGGSTDAADGLTLAYQLAGEAATTDDREVVLATDGAALLGERAHRLFARIDQAREHGIGLVVVGCGSDERQQGALQALADRAHGGHCFLADADAARTFGTSLMPAHLQILARDVKVQVTWNPERVAYARLIGFDQRRLADRDFRREDADAGSLAHDIQATALFEVVLAEDGSGPIGDAHVRFVDTRAGAMREQVCALPGTLLAREDSPRLQLLACAAELAERLERGWWSNVRCTSWLRLIRAITSLPPSADAQRLARMATTACHLTTSPQGTR